MPTAYRISVTSVPPGICRCYHAGLGVAASFTHRFAQPSVRTAF